MTSSKAASAPEKVIRDLVFASLDLLDSEKLTAEQRAKAEQVYSLASALEDELCP